MDVVKQSSAGCEDDAHAGSRGGSGAQQARHAGGFMVL